MSQENEKVNINIETFEQMKGLEKRSIDSPITSVAEQSEAHSAAHANDITLSDSSLKALSSSIGINADYEPLMLVEHDPDGRIRPLAASDAPPSFIELKALEMEAQDNPAMETVVELKRFARALPSGQEKADLYQLAQDLARMLRAKELLPQSHEEGSDSLPAVALTPTFSLSATKFEIVQDTDPAPILTFRPERLADFAGIAAGRMVDFLTDESAKKAFIEDEREKFIGIGEGLNEAKENVKALARSGWTSVTDGTALSILTKALDINNDLHLVFGAALAAGSWLYKELPHLPESISKASDRYSHMSKREQGKIIGNAMFDFLNVDAAVEFPRLFANEFKHPISNGKAVDNVLQVLMSSACDKSNQFNMERLRGVFRVANEVISSPEFRQLLEDAVKELAQTGPRKIVLQAGGPFDEQFVLMMGGNAGGKGGGDFYEAWRKFKNGLEKSTPQEKLLTAKELNALPEAEAKDKILLHMVEKMENLNASAAADISEHYMQCYQALRELPIFDLIALYRKEHKFYFPEKLEDVFAQQAKRSADLESKKDLLCENLPGATFLTNPNELKKVSVVPQKYVHDKKGTFIESSKLHQMEGIVRHEAAQRLGDLYKWRLMDNFYKTDKNQLIKLFKKLDQPDLDTTERIKIQKLKEDLDENYILNEVSNEQMLADLYATAHGGSAIPVIENSLTQAFGKTYDFMNKKNWLREYFED